MWCKDGTVAQVRRLTEKIAFMKLPPYLRPQEVNIHPEVYIFDAQYIFNNANGCPFGMGRFPAESRVWLVT